MSCVSFLEFTVDHTVDHKLQLNFLGVGPVVHKGVHASPELFFFNINLCEKCIHIM